MASHCTPFHTATVGGVTRGVQGDSQSLRQYCSYVVLQVGVLARWQYGVCSLVRINGSTRNRIRLIGLTKGSTRTSCEQKHKTELSGYLADVPNNVDALHYLCLPARGGVAGREPPLEPRPPYAKRCFFSAGFRIWNEHINVSSTLIMAPELSNSPQ